MSPPRKKILLYISDASAEQAPLATSFFTEMHAQLISALPPPWREQIENFSFLKMQLPLGKISPQALGQALQGPVDMVFLEMYNLQEHFLHSLVLLKKHRKFMSVPFIGIFRHKQALIAGFGYGAYGLTLSFYPQNANLGFSREELLDIFIQSFLLTYTSGPALLAEKDWVQLHLPSNISVPALLSYITPDSLGLELDVPLAEESEILLNAEVFSLHPDGEFRNCRVSLASPQPARYHALHTAEVQLTEVGADQHAFLPWIEKNSLELSQKDTSILVVNYQLDPLTKLYPYIDYMASFLMFSSELDANFTSIFHFFPQIIIWQAEDESEQLLPLLVKRLGTQENYRPFIMLFSSSQLAVEIRQKLNYPFLLIHQQDFDLNLLPELIELYRKSKKNQILTDKFFFKMGHGPVQAKISRSITLCNLGQRGLSFYYDGYLPPYSIYILPIPRPLLFLLLPNVSSQGAIQSHQGQQKYYGHFFGLDQEDKKSLQVLMLLFKDKRGKADVELSEVFAPVPPLTYAELQQQLQALMQKMVADPSTALIKIFPDKGEME